MRDRYLLLLAVFGSFTSYLMRFRFFTPTGLLVQVLSLLRLDVYTSGQQGQCGYGCDEFHVGSLLD